MNTSLFTYLIRLADTPLILSQRLAEWCGHGPYLEEDIAMTNISLDLVGQARALLSYAAEAEGAGRTEDDLAFLRGEREFLNVLLAEQPNGDFAKTMLRQFFLSAYQVELYTALQSSSDARLAALAEKSRKEVLYHLRHSAEWIKRLGDGTDESRQRMLQALDELWLYTGDLFQADETDRAMAASGVGVDPSTLQVRWEKHIADVFADAGLTVPQQVFMITGSREGKHSEHLGHMLSEMQMLQRTYPGVTW